MIQRKQSKEGRSGDSLSPSRNGRNSNFRTELSSIKENTSDTKSYNRIGKQKKVINE
tara:strand:- start:150 stop:320 length:171 start_codon:yes stop_codon:yes gene_type:complete